MRRRLWKVVVVRWLLRAIFYSWKIFFHQGVPSWGRLHFGSTLYGWRGCWGWQPKGLWSLHLRLWAHRYVFWWLVKTHWGRLAWCSWFLGWGWSSWPLQVFHQHSSWGLPPGSGSSAFAKRIGVLKSAFRGSRGSCGLGSELSSCIRPSSL